MRPIVLSPPAGGITRKRHLAPLRRTFSVGLLLLVSFPVAAEASGGSVPGCAFNEETGVLSVAPIEPEPSPPWVVARSGGSILVNGESCGDTTVTTVETIEIIEAGAVAVLVSLAGGPFAPGRTDEGDGSSEIEIVFVGYSPDVTFAGSAGADHLTAGGYPDQDDPSLNLYADETTPDLDVTFEAPVPDLKIELGDGDDTYSEAGIGDVALPLLGAGQTVRAGTGDDTIELAYGSARTYIGGPGVDALSFRPLEVACIPMLGEGEASIGSLSGPCPGGSLSYQGFERFVGHAGVDWFSGDRGADTIATRAGDDRLFASRGDDLLHGGSGRDTAIWSRTRRVRVDLRDGTAIVGRTWSQALRRVEDLVGSPFDDVLVGDRNGNVIRGDAGDDDLRGGGGVDELHGGDGLDRCRVGSPGAGETATGCEG